MAFFKHYQHGRSALSLSHFDSPAVGAVDTLTALFGLSPRAKMGPSEPNFWLELSPTPISKMID
jgi:hypothetical protein